MIRKYSVFWETSVTVKHKKSFSRVAKFYKIDGKILEAEQKMYASFRHVRGLGYMTVPKMLETMHENDLFDIFQYFLMWYISLECYLLHCVLQNDHSVRCADSENVLPQHHWQQCVSNIALINTETPDRIIDILGRQNGKDIYFF